MNVTERQRNYILFTGVYAVLSIILYLVVYFTDMPSSVCDGYFPYADAMMDGTFPYTEKIWVYDDWNSWEYPPLAYVFVLIPRLFCSSVAGYQAAFLVMTGLFFILGLWCAERLACIFDRDRFRVMALYTLLMVLMFEFLADRYDIIPAVMTLLAIVFVLEGKYSWAFVLISAGTMVKLYPAILFPILVIFMLARKETKPLLKGLVAFTVFTLTVLAVFYIGGGDPFSFMEYHMDRPLELESPAASIAEIASLLGISDVTYAYEFGSDNVYGAIPDFFSEIMFPLMAVVLILLYAHYAFWTLRSSVDKEKLPVDTGMVLCLAMLTFILVSTVFSGQYMVWLIPFVMLLYLLPGRGQERDWMLKLFIIGEVLTQLDFLVNYGMRGQGEALSAAGIIVLLIRNAVMVLLYLGMTWRLIENDRGMPRFLGGKGPA